MYTQNLLPSRIKTGALTSQKRRREIAQSSVSRASTIPLALHNSTKEVYKLDGNKLFLPRLRPNFITQRQIEDLYSRTLAAQKAIKKKETEASKTEGQDLQKSRHEIMKSFFQPQQGNKEEEYLNHPVIRQVVTDSITGDYAKTTSLAGAYNTNFRLSPFQLYKQDSPSLGFFAFRNIDIPENLRERFPSEARSINVYKASPGLTNPDLVASFTDFIPSSRKNDPNAPAYYKVNRFLKRTLDTLKPVIKKHVNGDIFNTLLKAKDEDIMEANAIWLTRHESEHGKDRLPLLYREDHSFDLTNDSPETRAKRKHNAQAGHALKNNLNGGAWEELRVDLKVILSAYEPSSTEEYGNRAKYLVRNLVLAERLLGYACRLDKEEFDAKTSAILRNFLLDKGVIEINDRNILTVNEDQVEAGLRELLTEMEKIEEEISIGPELELDKKEQKSNSEFKKARKKIDNFVDKWSVDKQERNEINAIRSRNFVKATKRTANNLRRKLSSASESIQRRYQDSLQTTINTKQGKTSDAITEDFNPMPDIDNNTEIILYDLDIGDISNVARARDYKTVAELDKEFADYIFNYNLEDPTKQNSDIKILKAILSKTSTFDNDFPDEIVYYASADAKNELDQDDIGLYRKLILDLLNDCFKDEFQAYCKVFSFDNEDLNNQFFSRIERLLRCVFRPKEKNGLLDIEHKSLVDRKRNAGEIRVREELKPQWLNEKKPLMDRVKERPIASASLGSIATGLISLAVGLPFLMSSDPGNSNITQNNTNASRNTDSSTGLHPVNALHEALESEYKEYSAEFLAAAKAGLENPYLCSKNRSLGLANNLRLNVEINEEEIDLGKGLKMTVPIDLKPETKELLVALIKELLRINPGLEDTIHVYRITDLPRTSPSISIRGQGVSIFITKESLRKIIKKMEQGYKLGEAIESVK